MKKPVLQTLRMLVEMKGQCTMEEIVEWSGIPKPNVLRTLHKNKKLIRTKEKDPKILLGDKLRENYRSKRLNEIKTWGHPKYS